MTPERFKELADEIELKGAALSNTSLLIRDHERFPEVQEILAADNTTPYLIEQLRAHPSMMWMTILTHKEQGIPFDTEGAIKYEDGWSKITVPELAKRWINWFDNQK